MNLAAVMIASGALVLRSDMAVAVAVDPVADDVLWQHLHLADLAGPGAGRGRGIEVAVVDHLDGGDQLRAEQFRPAAVMRQRRQRVRGC